MKTILPRLVCLLGLVALSALISGCGNKGPLVPPKAALSLAQPLGVDATEPQSC
ncbi:MAG: sugar transporter [Burkholderiales bacterium]|nr:MAG: sugar transporter [Betaproteobacteria bacterium]TAG83683.1 MAG: sugar transporter [Burkholderiales bacterium]